MRASSLPERPSSRRFGAARLRLACALSGALLLATSGGAQDLRSIRDRYVSESQLLDADLDNYLDVREREEEALRRLIDLGRELDRAMADASVPSADLVRLHAQIGEARSVAFDLSEDAGGRREEMGGRMRRMQGLLEELRGGGVEYVDPNGEVGGTWLVQSNEGLGLMSLVQSRGRATGIYRLSNGRHGTARGTLRGQQLRLDFDDADFGPVGTLVGQLDPTGELSGQWSARELAAGRPTGGTWRARRLSFEDLLTLEP